MVALDAEVFGLEVIQRLAPADPGETETLEVEHVEQAKPVVVP